MEETVVVIHGSKYPNPNTKNLFLRNLVRFGYKIFKVTPDMEYPEVREKWLSKIAKKGRDILYFDWEGKPLPKYVNKAAQDLINLIKTKDNVKIITNSIGAAIALKVSERVNNVKKIISLSGVYRKSKADVDFLDVRSKDDKFANVCKAGLNLLSFTKMKNRKLVLIEKFRHHEFQKDKQITGGNFKGMNISQILEYFLSKETQNQNI
ncbi:MAG: hypothetical protein PHW96_03735 [Candidatus Nanoarchaeia archaeon]|nr:hypothetical protein [Candidatus Nanoarchaeia archaeon]